MDRAHPLMVVIAAAFALGSTACSISPSSLRPLAVPEEEGAVFGKILISNNGVDVTGDCKVAFTDENWERKAFVSMDSTGWVFITVKRGRAYLSDAHCLQGGFAKYSAQYHGRDLELDVPGEGKIAYFGHVQIDMHDEGPSNGEVLAGILLGAIGGGVGVGVGVALAANRQVEAPSAQVENVFGEAIARYQSVYGEDASALQPLVTIAPRTLAWSAAMTAQATRAAEAAGRAAAPARAAEAARAAEQAASLELEASYGGFWTAWATMHGESACPDALRLLTSESECAGAACRAPLLLSSGYQKSCQIDTEARISLHRMRRRWEEAAGTTISECLKETYRASLKPAKAATLQERCASEGRTEAALRDAVRRRSAQPSSPTPSRPR